MTGSSNTRTQGDKARGGAQPPAASRPSGAKTARPQVSGSEGGEKQGEEGARKNQGSAAGKKRAR
jgi:hypothetical protein